MGGTSDAGTPIEWYIQTKPVSEGDETIRKTVNRIWVVADIEPGSTFNIGYGTGTEGNTFTTVYSTTNGTGQLQSINVPVVVRTPEVWFRLGLSGTGKAKIHRIVRELSRRNA
jgi:hypothetical protein